MSDTTSLSSNYSVTAAFAKEFNEAVLTLKRRHLAKDAVLPPTDEDEAKARKKLAQQLRGVLSELDAACVSPPQLAEGIPDGVLNRLSEKNQDKMTWFIADLRQLERALDGTDALSQNDFAALDEVCDAADATASASFRRLWRR